jgi:hypothetical protein
MQLLGCEHIPQPTSWTDFGYCLRLCIPGVALSEILTERSLAACKALREPRDNRRSKHRPTYWYDEGRGRVLTKNGLSWLNGQANMIHACIGLVSSRLGPACGRQMFRWGVQTPEGEMGVVRRVHEHIVRL